MTPPSAHDAVSQTRNGREATAIVLLLAAVPLAIPLAIDVWGTISFSVLHVVAGALLVASLLRGMSGVDVLAGGRGVALLLAAMLALGIINLAYSRDLPRGIAHWVLAAFLFAGYVVTYARVRSPELVLNVIRGFLLTSVPILGYGIVQSSLPSSAVPDWAPHAVIFLGAKPVLRAFGTFENVLYLALYANLVFCVAFARVVGGRSLRARAFPALVALLALGAIFRTASVGALIGILVASVVVLALGRPARLLLLPVILAALFFAMPEAFRYKILGIFGGFSTSLSSRALLYESSIRLMMDNPILGVGLGSVEEAMLRGYRLSYASAVGYNAENFFLERGAESGIPGLCLYVALFWIAFRSSWRGWRIASRDADSARTDATRAVLAFLVGFVAQGQMIVVGNFGLMALLGVFVALAVCLGNASSAPFAPEPVERAAAAA